MPHPAVRADGGARSTNHLALALPLHNLFLLLEEIHWGRPVQWLHLSSPGSFGFQGRDPVCPMPGFRSPTCPSSACSVVSHWEGSDPAIGAGWRVFLHRSAAPGRAVI